MFVLLSLSIVVQVQQKRAAEKAETEPAPKGVMYFWLCTRWLARGTL